MSEINNSDSIAVNENSQLKEQEILHALRSDRNNIIKEKVKNEYLTNFILECNKAKDEEIKNITSMTTQLKKENKELKETVENELPIKSNFGQETVNISNLITVFSEQLNEMKNTLQVFDVNITSIDKSKKQLHSQIFNSLKEQKIIDNNREVQINELKQIQSIENDNLNKILKNNKEILDEQSEKILQIAKNEQTLFEILQQQKNNNLKIVDEIKQLKNIQQNLQSNCTESQGKNTESSNNYNTCKLNIENDIIQLEIEIANKEDKEIKVQNEIEILQENHKKIEDEILQIQNNLNNSEIEENEHNNQIAEISSKLQDLVIKKLDMEEKSKQITNLKEELKKVQENYTEWQKKKEKLHNDISKNRIEIIKNIKEKCSIRYQEIADLTQENERINQNKIELSNKFKNETKEYTDKINEVEMKIKQSEEIKENIKKEIMERNILISAIKDKIRTVTDGNASCLEKLKNIFKNKNDELKSVKKEYEKLKAEFQKNKISIDNDMQKTEKKLENEINKIKAEMNKVKENMNTKIKNEDNNHVIEKKLLDDTIMSLVLQISEQKLCKENLQNEISIKIKEILDTTNKIEIANTETEVKNVEDVSKTVDPNFKAPALLTNNKRIRKSILKKQNNKKTTQTDVKPTKAVTEAQENDSPDVTITQIEINTDTNISMTQINEKKTNVNTQFDNLKKVSVWPTDNETSDDNFNKKPLTQQVNKRKSTNTTFWATDDELSDNFSKNKNLVTSTQKLEDPPKKLDHFDFCASDDENDAIFNSLKCNEPIQKKIKTEIRSPQELKKTVANFWGKETDSSEDSFFGKLDKSKKIQKNLKSTNVINLDSSLSDF